MKLITEGELEDMMKGYATVEPKSEPFERMAETITQLYKILRIAQEHSVGCAGVEDGFHAALDAFHYHE